jgi:sulfur carrier protein
MPIILNGESFPLPPSPATLERLLKSMAPEKPFAVARNQEFVPSSAYAQCELQDGDRIDIVHPSAGG